MNSWSKKNFKENGLMQGDMVIWMILLCLCFISIITVYSASSNMTYGTGKYWAPVMRHGAFLLMGIGFTWVLHMLPCKLYKIIGLGISLLSYALPKRIILAIRLMSTVVLPLPAPASSSNGP